MGTAFSPISYGYGMSSAGMGPAPSYSYIYGMSVQGSMPVGYPTEAYSYGGYAGYVGYPGGGYVQARMCGNGKR